MTFLRSRFRTLYVLGAVYLAVCFALRVALAAFGAGEIDHGILTYVKIFGAGLFFDLVAFAYIAAAPALVLLMAPERLFRLRAVRWMCFGLYAAAVATTLFNACAEWFFWEEFSARYNFVAVDYLVYTGEVVGNISQSYPLWPIFGGIAIATAAVAWWTRRTFARAFETAEPMRSRLAHAGAILAAAALSLAFVSASMTRVSDNFYVNELASNGFYSFGVAWRLQELDYDRYYPTMPEAEAFVRLRARLGEDNARFASNDPMDITRAVSADGPERRLNVLFIVVESLSAKYFGIFGHPDGLTPNLDNLSTQSLFFRNAYATGTRTNRGLEALTLSLPPTPGQSIVQRPRNENLFSIGPIFRERGYETKFIYSGYGLFDNMNRFFRGNGFETVDRSDFGDNEIEFANIWGVCDESLYAKMFRECDKSHAVGKRFCSVVLTTSNHRPYTFPAGRIDLPSGVNRAGAVKYTDWALGDMLRKAKAKPWFKDTVFVIMADHCANSAGKNEVSVEGYHIPVFIYGPGLVEPRQMDAAVSQMDVAPTVLGLLNFSYASRFFGRDALRGGTPRTLMSNYQKVGIRVGNRLTLLMPVRVTRTYRVGANDEETLDRDDPELRLDAIAYYQCAAHLLERGLYRPVPPAPPKAD